MNLVKALFLHRTPDGEETAWVFRFGKCEDFNAALAAVKTIPVSQRGYDADKDHQWTITPSPESEKILTQAFSNFESNLAAARAQLPLF